MKLADRLDCAALMYVSIIMLLGSFLSIGGNGTKRMDYWIILFTLFHIYLSLSVAKNNVPCKVLSAFKNTKINFCQCIEPVALSKYC